MLLRVELVISLNMVVNQQNPENQNSDIVASSSEAGTWLKFSFQFAYCKQCYHKVYQGLLLITFSSHLISIQQWKLVSLSHEVLYCVTLTVQPYYDVGKRYYVTMSLQCKYAMSLHRDKNSTKSRCRHNIAYLLGLKMNFLSKQNRSSRVLSPLESWVLKGPGSSRVLQSPGSLFSGMPIKTGISPLKLFIWGIVEHKIQDETINKLSNDFSSETI